MKTVKCSAVLIITLIPIVAAGKQAVTTKVDLHAEIQRVYNFQPHVLDDRQLQEKSAILDRFWSKAKSQREAYLPMLRQELADFTNPPFFLYDGSKLLLSLSSDHQDRRIALAAIAHCDLRDLQLIDYFMLVHGLAAEGEDTTAAAFHILEDPKFHVFIPQHVLTLGQNYSLVYLLIPTDENFWVGPAIERVRNETDETAQKSLLLLLWYAQRPECDKAVGGFASDPSKPSASRSYANELIHRKDKVNRAGRVVAFALNEQALREARRKRLQAVSDEALEDLDSYTVEIMAKRK
jgi:hypothetical protein